MKDTRCRMQRCRIHDTLFLVSSEHEALGRSCLEDLVEYMPILQWGTTCRALTVLG